jgi:hypothetical protein
MEYECKTITQWVKDPRCPLKKATLFKAIQNGNLVATMPKGCKMWLVRWLDLESYMNGK